MECFSREFLIARKIFNKSCKAYMFGKRNVWSQKQNSGFVEASSEICKASKERATRCKGHFIGREITTLLKIAVDNVILELCGSCDHFAGLHSWTNT